MFDMPLLKACVQQQQILEDLVTLPTTRLDRDSWADAVQFYAVYAEQLDRTQRRLLFTAAKVNHPETPGIGNFLTALIQAAIARGYLLKQAIGLASPVDHERDLFKAIDRLQQVLAVHERDWPQELAPTREDAVAAFERGEAQLLDEAFGEIANIDLGEWSRYVEEHRRRHPTQRVG